MLNTKNRWFSSSINHHIFYLQFIFNARPENPSKCVAFWHSKNSASFLAHPLVAVLLFVFTLARERGTYGSEAVNYGNKDGFYLANSYVSFLYDLADRRYMAKKGYELIICEKPQAAQKIATALATDNFQKHAVDKVPYYELEHKGKNIVVAAAVGHLFGLAEKDKKTWTYPVFSVEWKRANEIHKGHFSKKYADLIQKLAKDAETITVATDYDVEGEVIGLNIVRYLCKKKDAHRMKFSTLVAKDILESYAHKAKTLNWGQANAGETRHILDWYWGINLSRALTLAVKKERGGFKVLSAGRVQGPALKLLVDREKQIAAFVSQPYWQLCAHLIKESQNLLAWHEKDKFWDQKEVDAIYTSLKKEKKLTVTNIASTTTKQSPPIPFDLTTLQTEAHKTCSISPKDTLEIAQNLYTQGFISYPRTSSQKLPQQLGLKNILQQLGKQQAYAVLIKRLLSQKTLQANEGKKTDDAHPAIYPTGIVPEKLASREHKIYDLIVHRFMSVFGEPALRETMRVTLQIKKEPFIVEGTRTKEKGWHIYYEPYLKLAEVELPKFTQGETIDLKKLELLAKETQPPKRYTESSIIRALEKTNIGTKSTRAQIIETLKDRKYVSAGNSLTATSLGIATVETLQQHAPKILDEALTRRFEEEMEDVRCEKRKEDEVLHEAEKVLRVILKDFKKEEAVIGKELGESERLRYAEENTLGECLSCKKGQLLMRRGKFGQFVGCTQYPECKQTFALPKNQMVKPAHKACVECQYPTVLVRAPRSNEREVCINPKCITWTQAYQAAHKENEATGQLNYTETLGSKDKDNNSKKKTTKNTSKDIPPAIAHDEFDEEDDDTEDAEE